MKPEVPMPNQPQGQERRQTVRIKKHFILRFFLKNEPTKALEISQVEDISKGGICFTSTINFKKGDILGIELRTPYISDAINLEGTIVAIHDKIKGMIYQNHLQFQNITPAASAILEKIEQYNSSSEAP